MTAAERLLPMGVAEGCTVIRPVAKDATLTYDDVELPAGPIDRQAAAGTGGLFEGATVGAEGL